MGNNYGNIRGSIGGNSGSGSGSGSGSVSGGCSGTSGSLGQRVTTGVVVTVNDNSFDVRTADGQVYTVNVAPCTQLNANKANYSMQPGHTAVVKGW